LLEKVTPLATDTAVVGVRVFCDVFRSRNQRRVANRLCFFLFIFARVLLCGKPTVE